MKNNMGNTDRTIRIMLGIAALLIIVFLTTVIHDTTNMIIIGVILYVFAVIMILTSIIGVSPLYIPFKISTKKIDE